MSNFSVILVMATLLALFLYSLGSQVDSSFFLGLGPGGMERMVANPALLWAIGLGGR